MYFILTVIDFFINFAYKQGIWQQSVPLCMACIAAVIKEIGTNYYTK